MFHRQDHTDGTRMQNMCACSCFCRRCSRITHKPTSYSRGNQQPTKHCLQPQTFQFLHEVPGPGREGCRAGVYACDRANNAKASAKGPTLVKAQDRETEKEKKGRSPRSNTEQSIKKRGGFVVLAYAVPCNNCTGSRWACIESLTNTESE
jgi:hypothetical protein